MILMSIWGVGTPRKRTPSVPRKERWGRHIYDIPIEEFLAWWFWLQKQWIGCQVLGNVNKIMVIRA